LANHGRWPVLRHPGLPIRKGRGQTELLQRSVDWKWWTWKWRGLFIIRVSQYTFDCYSRSRNETLCRTQLKLLRAYGASWSAPFLVRHFHRPHSAASPRAMRIATRGKKTSSYRTCRMSVGSSWSDVCRARHDCSSDRRRRTDDTCPSRRSTCLSLRQRNNQRNVGTHPNATRPSSKQPATICARFQTHAYEHLHRQGSIQIRRRDTNLYFLSHSLSRVNKSQKNDIHKMRLLNL